MIFQEWKNGNICKFLIETARNGRHLICSFPGMLFGGIGVRSAYKPNTSL
jgi:hypothetical protein